MEQDRRQVVRNAADPRQVRFAEQLGKRRAERFTQALAAVMNTPEGRIVLAALVRRAGVFKSIWSPSSEIHYNAGRQDYGHELMADLIGLDEDRFQLMEREEWAWAKAEERTIAAAHTARASGDRDGGRDE